MQFATLTYWNSGDIGAMIGIGPFKTRLEAEAQAQNTKSLIVNAEILSMQNIDGTIVELDPGMIHVYRILPNGEVDHLSLSSDHLIETLTKGYEFSKPAEPIVILHA